MKGIERDDVPRNVKFTQELLGRGDLVRLVLNLDMGQYEGGIDGKSAENLSGFSVLEVVKTVPESPSGNDIAFSRTQLLSSFIFDLFSRTSAVTTTPWRILSTAMSCYNPDLRRNSRTKTFFFP
jgi:hypothetical protein